MTDAIRRRNDLDGLTPEFRAKVEVLLYRLRLRGHVPWVYETRRTPERQAYLYASGRTRPGPKVTWTRESKHLHGLAVDIIDGREHPTRPGDRVGWGTWGDPISAGMAERFFSALGDEAKAIGLVWGGDWKSRDLPHVEM